MVLGTVTFDRYTYISNKQYKSGSTDYWANDTLED